MARLYEEEGDWLLARSRLREMAGEEHTDENGFGEVDFSAQKEVALQPPFCPKVEENYTTAEVSWENYETPKREAVVGFAESGEVIFSTSGSSVVLKKKYAEKQVITLRSADKEGNLSVGAVVIIPGSY